MIATHKIKKNGRWYYAGEEIDSSPVGSVNLSEEISEENNEPEYTKTDIHRMPVEKLRSLAAEQGIDGVEEMNGADIKKLLLEKIES